MEFLDLGFQTPFVTDEFPIGDEASVSVARREQPFYDRVQEQGKEYPLKKQLNLERKN